MGCVRGGLRGETAENTQHIYKVDMYTWLLLAQLSVLLAVPTFLDSPDDDTLQSFLGDSETLSQLAAQLDNIEDMEKRSPYNSEWEKELPMGSVWAKGLHTTLGLESNPLTTSGLVRGPHITLVWARESSGRRDGESGCHTTLVSADKSC